MRYFYDTEFIEDGRTIELVSIGVVAADGREFFAVSTEFDPGRAGPWVRANVLEQLPSPSDPAWRSRERIRDGLFEFLRADSEEPELWAWYGDYDHVVLCQLWGAMPALPLRLPRFTRDLRQLWDDLGRPPLPRQEVGQHDALEDARQNVRIWETCQAARWGQVAQGGRPAQGGQVEQGGQPGARTSTVTGVSETPIADAAARERSIRRPST